MEHKLIFKAIVGSQAYGMATATSDIDIKGVFVQHPDEILSDKYCDYLEVSKDECYFEICKFINLLKSANPTALELLYSPKECIQYIHPSFEILLSERDIFLTKKCCNSFAEYGKSQLDKAFSLDKKMNWENNRISKKTPFDFCWVYVNGGTQPVEKYLKDNNMNAEYCGLVALDHIKDGYALYYKENAGYRGISMDSGNAVRTTSVPKGEIPLIFMAWNKDGYSKFVKDYKDYQIWLTNRNSQRFIETTKHKQKIDGKNCSHCVRLISTAEEIAKEKTLNVYRYDAEYLLSIRRGEVDLEDIIKLSKSKIEGLKELFEKSELPDNVNTDACHKLLIDIRKKIYD